MTQHQAPEVTSEDIALAEEIVSAANIVSHDGYYEVDIDRAAATIAAHRTRATQPLSLTVDEGVRHALRSTLAAYETCRRGQGLSDSEVGTLPVVMQARAALDRLQSLSLPVAGEQIAENANCSGDIDRSGLAQEVEK